MQFGQWVGFAFWRDGGCADCHNLSKLNNSCNKDLRGRGGGGGGNRVHSSASIWPVGQPQHPMYDIA